MSNLWLKEVKRLASEERLRPSGTRPYSGLAFLDSPTAKQEGSPIIGTDTIKGCRNGCFRCYANRISRLHCKLFHEPVRCSIAGIPDPEAVYRFGTFGDPACDWAWTFHELERLQRRGMNRFYILSKLQSVKGFRDNPSLCLHVSFDPLDVRQLTVTMRNFDLITARKIVRLKSVRSAHRVLMALQERVTRFARERGAPMLETRFYTHVKKDLALLRMQGYERHGTLFKYPGSVLGDCFGLEGHRVCDRMNTGKCRDCLNCLAYLT